MNPCYRIIAKLPQAVMMAGLEDWKVVEVRLTL